MRPARRRVLEALLAVYERDGRATVRAVMTEAGLASMNTVHVHLRNLREQGLVSWVEGQAGTLRPLAVRAGGVPWERVDG